MVSRNHPNLLGDTRADPASTPLSLRLTMANQTACPLVAAVGPCLTPTILRSHNSPLPPPHRRAFSAIPQLRATQPINMSRTLPVGRPDMMHRRAFTAWTLALEPTSIQTLLFSQTSPTLTTLRQTNSLAHHRDPTPVHQTSPAPIPSAPLQPQPKPSALHPPVDAE